MTAFLASSTPHICVACRHMVSGLHRCRFVFTIGGGGDDRTDRCPRRGSEATERGEGVGGGYLPPTVGTFSKIRVSKSHFRVFKNEVLRE